MKNKNLKLYIVIGICLIAVCSAVILLVDNKKEDNLDTRTTTQTTTQITTTEESTTEESTTTKETSSKTTSTTDTVIFTTPEIIDKVEIPIEDVEGIEDTTSNKPNYLSLGKFKLTAYCKCSKCCGKWSGSPTASGVMPKANRTIAVDTSIIPFGTEVIINGNTYIAEDTGSAIKGNKIDIYMPSHQEALNFGVQYAEVFVVNK